MRRVIWPHQRLTMRFMYEKGCTIQQIAKFFASSWATAQLHAKNGDKKVSQRGKISQNAEKRVKARRELVRRLAAKKTVRGCLSARGIANYLNRQHGIHVHKSTVTRDLKLLGLVARVRPRVPTVSEKDYDKRLKACKILHNVDSAQIVFSDEKIFTANDFTNRYCWTRPGQAVPPRERKRWAPALMVWGAVGVGFRLLVCLGKGKVTARAYARRCLQGKLINYVQSMGRIFQHDGAACHRAGSVTRYLARKGIKVLTPWPARSPDISPIETVWAILAPRVAAHAPTTAAELRAAVFEEWEKMDVNMTDRCVLSFHRRVGKVIRNKGRYT